MSSSSKTKKRVKDGFKGTKLYPPIKALGSYFMKVSDLHTVAYWTYGNPKGLPVVFIHGGPGGGTTPECARYFDPKAFFIVLVDQRGCGMSTPMYELRENTTPHLIEDFEKIREHLGISKWLVFGGSWGSTLSLAYAIAHPECSIELIIRGIFLCRKQEIDWFLRPNGTDANFRDTRDIFEDGLPKSEQKEDRTKIDYLAAYGRCFRGEHGAAAKEKALLSWSTWETSVSHLVPIPVPEIIKDYKKTGGHRFMSLIEHHYFSNGGFFGGDNYFLEKKNYGKISHIPITIVQGRYDVLCPMTTAYDVCHVLPQCKMHLTLAGHSAFEPDNIAKLVDATNAYKKKRHKK